MKCCELSIKEVIQQEDEDVCDSCYDRIENDIIDLQMMQAKEDLYDWKYKDD